MDDAANTEDVYVHAYMLKWKSIIQMQRSERLRAVVALILFVHVASDPGMALAPIAALEVQRAETSMRAEFI